MSQTEQRNSDSALAEINEIGYRGQDLEDGQPAGSLIGIWLCLPMAVSAVGLGGVEILNRTATSPLGQFGLLLPLVLQTVYWMILSERAGRKPWFGLWALIPVFGYLPLFAVARSATRVARPGAQDG